MNKKIMFCIINLIVSIIVTSIIYTVVFSKNKSMYKERIVVYDRFYNVDKQIDDFVVTQVAIDEQEKSILETITPFKETFYPNAQILNDYKSRVFTLFRKLEVMISEKDLVQTQERETISLSVKFKITYEQLCKLLFELEKFSEIKNISYDFKKEASIKCSPILYSSQVSDSFSGRNNSVDSGDDLTKAGYFKEIVDKIQEVKDVGYIPSWRDFEPIPASPFFYYFDRGSDPKKTKVILKDVSKPDISIDGIMYEENNSIVIIEGNFYRVGDRYKNAKIIKITQNSIKIDCNGKKYTIGMGI